MVFFSRYRLTNDTDQLQNVRSSFRFSSWLRVTSQSRNFGLNKGQALKIQMLQLFELISIWDVLGISRHSEV